MFDNVVIGTFHGIHCHEAKAVFKDDGTMRQFEALTQEPLLILSRSTEGKRLHRCFVRDYEDTLGNR